MEKLLIVGLVIFVFWVATMSPVTFAIACFGAALVGTITEIDKRKRTGRW